MFLNISLFSLKKKDNSIMMVVRSLGRTNLAASVHRPAMVALAIAIRTRNIVGDVVDHSPLN